MIFSNDTAQYFDINGFCTEGTNELCIEVRMTLERKVQAMTEHKNPGRTGFLVTMPSGIVGDVKVRFINI